VSDLRFPRLADHAPVLDRSDREWQVGLEPGQALVFHGDGFGPVLGMLDGLHAMPVVRDVARAAGLKRPQLDSALAALLAAGLLHDRDQPVDAARPPPRIRLVGAGAVGRQLAALLVDSGVGALYVFDDQPSDPGPLASQSLGSRGQALCAQLVNRGPAAVVSVSHWSKPEAPAVDLTVVAADAPEVDRLVTDHLLRTDQPHLIIRGHGLGVCVGPLVQPGRTSCLRCADLARRDADPQWPTVLNQLTRIGQTAPPALVSWAAAVAAVQSLAFLGGATPETTGATLEMGTMDYAMRWRSWPAHPECGCGWSTIEQWGA
jgi:hypothetical protein